MLKGLCWNLMICLVTVTCMIHGDYFTKKVKNIGHSPEKGSKEGAAFLMKNKNKSKTQNF